MNHSICSRLHVSFGFAVVTGFFGVAAFAEEAGTPYEICLKGNAENRAALKGAPKSSPEGLKKFTALFVDDRTCECIRDEDARAGNVAQGAKQRFIAENAKCLSSRVNNEFPAICPGVFTGFLPPQVQNRVPTEKVQEVCTCAVSRMREIVTPAALLQWQLEQFKYFDALVADRQNHTHLADNLPRPGPGPVERGTMGSVQSCTQEIFGKAPLAPAKGAQRASPEDPPPQKQP